MVHAAIHDAANAIGKTHKVYKVSVEAPASASAEAAVAAHRVGSKFGSPAISCCAFKLYSQV